MNINNVPTPAKVLKWIGMINHLGNMKFQAYHVASKQEAEAMKPQYERLLTEATAIGIELAKEYPVFPDDVSDETYKMLYGIDKPKKESKVEWYKRMIAEDGDIY